MPAGSCRLRVAAYQVADGFALLRLGSWLSARIADTPQIDIQTEIKSIETGNQINWINSAIMKGPSLVVVWTMYRKWKAPQMNTNIIKTNNKDKKIQELADKEKEFDFQHAASLFLSLSSRFGKKPEILKT